MREVGTLDNLCVAVDHEAILDLDPLPDWMSLHGHRKLVAVAWLQHLEQGLVAAQGRYQLPKVIKAPQTRK
jgi:hypothetical protein